MEGRRYLFLPILFIGFLITICLLINKQEKGVLGLEEENKETPTATPVTTITPTPTMTPSSSPSLSPTPSSTATPTITPKPLPTATPVSSQEVNGFIERFSAQYGVDPNVVRHVAICESGFRSNAVQGIYVGLFQFGPTTWKNIRVEFGEDPNPSLRFSAEESVQTAAYAISKGKGGIWPNCLP